MSELTATPQLIGLDLIRKLSQAWAGTADTHIHISRRYGKYEDLRTKHEDDLYSVC